MAIDTQALRALDAADPLAAMRSRFRLPDGIVYLDGNSLGALPANTPERLREVVLEEWGGDLIRSWNTRGWIEAPRRVGAKLASLIGAEPGEVAIADSTSVNLFKLLAAALVARPGRSRILSEPGNFPTDLYVASGAAEMRGARLETVQADQLVDAIDDDVACVMLTHVHYKSGRRWDMGAVTAAAQAKGALVLWDLSHSAGGVDVDLNGCNADLAVGCGYKYLNGGPGAPAFLFVARRHLATLRSPLTGWMGHATPFAFGDDYVAADGIERFLCGTPPILGIAALDEGISLLAEVDRAALYEKSAALCDLFIALMDAACPEFTLITPREAAGRGSHVSYAHPEAYAICQALIARGVIGDFRAPDVLRFGFTPLYTRYEDVGLAVEGLADVMARGSWTDPAYRVRSAVT